MKTIVFLIITVLFSLGLTPASANANPCGGELNDKASIYAGSKKIGETRVYFSDEGGTTCLVTKSLIGKTKMKIKWRVYNEYTYNTGRWHVKRSTAKVYSKQKHLMYPRILADWTGGIKYNGKWYWV